MSTELLKAQVAEPLSGEAFIAAIAAKIGCPAGTRRVEIIAEAGRPVEVIIHYPDKDPGTEIWQKYWLLDADSVLGQSDALMLDAGAFRKPNESVQYDTADEALAAAHLYGINTHWTEEDQHDCRDDGD